MRSLSKNYYWTFPLIFIFSLIGFYFFPNTQADGGAPNLAYVSGTSSGISVIDVGQAKVTKTITVAGNPHTILLKGGIFGPMDYDALTGEVYVPDAQHNLLTVLSSVDTFVATVPKEPERVIHIAGIPTSVAITNDGLLGFVALRGGRIAMFDLIAHQLVYTVVVGGTPHFIITGLFPPQALNTPLTSSNSISNHQSSISQVFWVIVFFASLVTIVVVTIIFVWQIRKSLKAEHPS